MKQRGAFKAQSNIYDEDFFQNSKQFNPNPDVWHFIKPPMNKNCRTINDIDIKPERICKLEKRNTIKSKRFDNDVILANYNTIVIFWFNGDSEQLESRSLDAMLTISKTELKDL